VGLKQGRVCWWLREHRKLRRSTFWMMSFGKRSQKKQSSIGICKGRKMTISILALALSTQENGLEVSEMALGL